MIYLTFILQLICFIIWIAVYFVKGNVLFLVAAAIMPFSALSTYFYYKKKRKALSDSNKDQKNI